MKRTLMVCALSSLAALGCAESKPEPRVASSASLPGYATRYPAELAAARTTLGAQEEEAAKLSNDFATYPGRVAEPTRWQAVRDVYELADVDGRSRAYVDRLQESEGVARFFNEQKGDLGRRVGGAAQFAAKDKQCDVDVATPARYALEKGVEKELEDSVRDRSDAQAAIDHSEDALGKRNVDTLKLQATAISRASYLVHVGAVEQAQTVSRMVDEGGDVRHTLDRKIQDLTESLQDAKVPEPRRKDLARELSEAQTSRAALDGELTQARDVEKTTKDRLKKMREAYDAAFKALDDDVKKRIK